VSVKIIPYHAIEGTNGEYYSSAHPKPQFEMGWVVNATPRILSAWGQISST